MLQIIDLNSNFSKVKRGHVLHGLKNVKSSIYIFYIQTLTIS